ncbi:hypothetical protein FB451DRAFT_1394245 [Mycena latifolia]|nr:hypothetical protein FB451DRAFT_1394245 [Mycena latifolia]
MFGLSAAHLQLLLDDGRKWFLVGSVVGAPAQLFIDAPVWPLHALPTQHIPCIKAWILMELVSPIFFLYALFRGPDARPPALGSPQSILALAYLIHYLNRALISPLRTPSRSKSHIIVPLAAVTFNTLNGSLMGAFLAAPAPPAPPMYFYAGLTLWASGFAGNIMHDEILLNIRRRAKDKPKGKGNGEHYAIPHGLLYRFISYPNYFCEWLEWLGFALAADPRLVRALFTGALFSGSFSLASVNASLRGPAAAFLPLFSPPWVFLLSEVLLMFPRAYRGHRWYHNMFGDSYPKERRIVVPFLL